MSKRNSVRIAHERLCAQLGRLPTSEEIASAAGVTVRYVRGELNALGLDYQRRTNGDTQPARLALAARAERRNEEFRRAHEELTRSFGRLPYLSELKVKTGRKTEDGVRDICKRLGLEYSDRRRRTEPPVQEERHEPEPVSSTIRKIEFNNRHTPAMTRILDIRMSGDPEKRPQRIERAGAEYSAADRIFIACPVCGIRRLIAPSMHPFWIRNRAGEVIWVDKAACTGGGAA